MGLAALCSRAPPRCLGGQEGEIGSWRTRKRRGNHQERRICKQEILTLPPPFGEGVLGRCRAETRGAIYSAGTGATCTRCLPDGLLKFRVVGHPPAQAHHGGNAFTKGGCRASLSHVLSMICSLRYDSECAKNGTLSRKPVFLNK